MNQNKIENKHKMKIFFIIINKMIKCICISCDCEICVLALSIRERLNSTSKIKSCLIAFSKFRATHHIINSESDCMYVAISVRIKKQNPQTVLAV